jgi:hypothetical protein
MERSSWLIMIVGALVSAVGITYSIVGNHSYIDKVVIMGVGIKMLMLSLCYLYILS